VAPPGKQAAHGESKSQSASEDAKNNKR